MYRRKPFNPEVKIKNSKIEEAKQKMILEELGEFIYIESARFVKVRFTDSIATTNRKKVASG